MHRTFLNCSKEKSRGLRGLTENAVPAAFSDAVKVEFGDCIMLFISGKLATDENHRLIKGAMREQTRCVLDNIKMVVEREGGKMDDIVRIRIYVTQLDSQALREIHEVRAEYFCEGKYPASTLVKVSELVRDGALIEIDADAIISKC